MRELPDAARLRQFMRLIGQRTRAGGRVFLVGGACAVWLDWRATTRRVTNERPSRMRLEARKLSICSLVMRPEWLSLWPAKGRPMPLMIRGRKKPIPYMAVVRPK